LYCLGVLKLRWYISKRVALVLAVILGAGGSQAGIAAAQTTTGPADPCRSTAVAKQSVATLNMGHANETIELILPSSQGVHVCGFLIDGGQFVLYYGGGLFCSWNPVVLYGPTVTTGKNSYAGPGTIFSVPANNALCLSTPTGAPVSGILTYTQP
jgi:hypothetical protein